MNEKYDHTKIESKWSEYWYKDSIYKADDFSTKPKKYILAELPYPSGKFLHVGHVLRYTVPEIYSRFLRMRGYNVMFPLGWDSFGLPAEVFAIKEGISPKEAIAQASRDYKKVLQNAGYAIDWSREINTSDPNYYKWTQWIFLKLWEKGLAEIREMPVWWCKELGVLADEEILTNDKGEKVSEKGGHAVERKMYKQWVLKIPAYADKLLDGLDEVDYPEAIKSAQRNWIGKKEGAEVDFEIGGQKATVFTTRPDTIYGVTFLAISPQHPMLNTLIDNATNKSEITNYIEQSNQLTDIEKQAKEKTGVLIEGLYATHPLTDVTRKIPIFVADYILMGYGTGVVMGVPAHDERDFEFAKKYNVEIIPVIVTSNPSNGNAWDEAPEGIMQNSGEYDGMNSADFKANILEKLEKEGKGKKATTYKMRDQVWARQRFWGDPIPLIHKKDGSIEADYNLPVKLPEVPENKIVKGEAFPALSEFEGWADTVDSKGNSAKRETDTMPTWAGSNWYYLRYIDPQNDKEFASMDKMKYWLPIDHYFGGSEHTTVHLLYSRFWHRFLFDNGYVPTKEPYAKRTNGGLLLGPDGSKMSKSKGNVLNPQDVIDNYGADVLRMYIAFIGPYEDTYPWNENGVRSCWRFIKNVYELKNKINPGAMDDEKLTKAYHKMIKRITKMCEELKMNTAISELMAFYNKTKEYENISMDIYKGFIKLMAPFAPFVTEELWQELNNYTQWKAENSLHLQPWPTFDEKLAQDEITQLPVQVNGKLRGQVEISENDTEDSIKQKAIELGVHKGNVLQVVYIPQRIVNIVTG